jgi:D-3-phosphoglycerate dehydrogenase
VYQPDLSSDALPKAIADTKADALVVRSTQVTADALAAPTLKLVVRAGSGVNTIDVKTATARGIKVANCPGRNAIAVAELAFGLMLALDRRIPDNVADLRAGHWKKKEYSKAHGLYGSTLGLLGVGHIGKEMIRRAAGFGMPVVLWSRRFDGQNRPLYASEAEAFQLTEAYRQISIAVAPSPENVASRCDILSLHIPLGPGTRRMINADLLARLKPGAMLINTSRGDLVDYDALQQAVRDRGIRVGLDVYEHEPESGIAEFTDAIVSAPSVYGTHHIGASTDQAQEAIAAETVRIIEVFMETGEAPNAVN